MEEILTENLYRLGIIPVLQIDNADRAVPVAEALVAGGLPVAEITFRTDAALDSLRKITRELPEMIVGAGTILHKEQAKAATDAGARFLISPGFDEELLAWAEEIHITLIPGIATATEIMCALRHGLTLLKFFPAEGMGGLKTIRSLSEPFPQVRFIPTGGIQSQDLAEYLQFNKIHAVGGSWLATRQMIQDYRFEEIARLATAARSIVKQIRG